ncbi:hypothetical protein BJF78_19400 [Pseudonocardia sp. CNS-139]|nr:hypothetical protein BJF78_19400 [Pseudonocardia sp. CNS-139]
MSIDIRPAADHPASWRRADLAASGSWRFPLDRSDVDELARAVAGVRARGLAVEDVTAADFPLPTMQPKLKAIAEQLAVGMGLALITGLPAHTRFSPDDTALVYWGIGRHLGAPLSQNSRGHLLGHVVDKRADGEAARPNKRLYEGGGAFGFHTDRGDVVGLLCFRKAKEGGGSLVASAMAMHDVMLDERPDLLELLYQPMHADWYGEEQPGDWPYYQTTVYSRIRGVLSCNLSTRPMRAAQRFPEVPRLDERWIEAFDYIDTLADRPELHYSMTLEEGEMQFLNNWTVVHAREDYVDHDEPELRRHLLRLWLRLPVERPCARPS